MDDRVSAFRTGVERLGGARRGMRYPQSLRAVAVSYWLDVETQGESLPSVAATLGVSPRTLSRWSESGDVEHAPHGALREVVVTTAEPSGALALVTPEGYRVEGLDVSSLTHLLRSLS